MYVRNILKRKGKGAVTITATELVATAVNVLSRKISVCCIGALIVESRGDLIGILDERLLFCLPLPILADAKPPVTGDKRLSAPFPDTAIFLEDDARR